ncbi:MAG: DNA repair exonuclease [Papillibacter sp.]|nr:DNA repair exonuclease [Papillibacter sp.]
MVRILHAADFHLDSPFASLSWEKAAERRKEQRRLLEQIAQLSENVDIVLLSGDLFDSGRAYGETVEALGSFFDAVKAKIFIAPGNHDYYAPKNPYSHISLPENVHIFKSPEISAVELSGLGCTVWGAAFTDQRSEPLLRGFSVKDKAGLNIMTLHGDTSFPDSPYGYISQADIEGSGLDYLALGHVHTCSGLNKAGLTYWAYPGCPLGRGFDETGVKGVIIAELDKGACNYSFVPLEGRRYECLSIDVTGAEDMAAIITAALGEGTENNIYRLVLTGTRSERPNIKALMASLENRFYSLELVDETRPGRDLWDSAGEETLKGNFLKILKVKYEAAENEAEREEIILAARYGLAALEYKEDV